MSDDKRREAILQAPDLTIVGGQPHGGRRRHRPWATRIPGGLELVLHKAATDPAFTAALLADREAALRACGLTLTPTERATLEAAPSAVLEAMVAGLKGRQRKPSATMRVVAAAAASLAAGTASLECGSIAPSSSDAGVDVSLRWGPDSGVITPTDDYWAPPPPQDAGLDADADAASAEEAGNDTDAGDAAGDEADADSADSSSDARTD